MKLGGADWCHYSDKVTFYYVVGHITRSSTRAYCLGQVFSWKRVETNNWQKTELASPWTHISLSPVVFAFLFSEVHPLCSDEYVCLPLCGLSQQSTFSSWKRRSDNDKRRMLFLCSASQTCRCNRQHKATTRVEMTCLCHTNGRKMWFFVSVRVTERDRKMS